MRVAKTVRRIQTIYNIFNLSLPFPMFPCLCVFQSKFTPCWELMIKGAVIRKGRLLSPDTPFLIASAPVYESEKKKKHALYFYEPCDSFCFVVRPLGMHSINFIETRYLETFAYV